jgi:hypothetical protein
MEEDQITPWPPIWGINEENRFQDPPYGGLGGRKRGNRVKKYDE